MVNNVIVINKKEIYMRYSDAHCDTLTAYKSRPFDSNLSHWNLEKFKSIGGILQYFAIFTPEEYSGSSALSFAVNAVGNFLRKQPQGVHLIENQSDFVHDDVNILLSLEGASPIINDIANLYAFYKLGIRAITLTWNHRNFLADGVDNDFGITQFGIEAIQEMERLGIIIDVSHLNINGFDDLLKYSTKPFIASHSNSYQICNHKRNLSNDQIREIIKRHGFIGINVFADFLGNQDEDLVHKFLEHIEHILDLGGEDCIGIGADFDGMELSPFQGVLDYPVMSDLLRNDLKLSEVSIEKIMYKNLIDFTLRNI